MSDLGRHGRNLSWMLIAEIIQKVLALVLFTYATRKLGLTENGWYGTYLAMFAVLVTIINGGFYDVAVRDIAQTPARVHGLVSTSLVLQLFLGAVVMGGIGLAAWLLRYPGALQQILVVGTVGAMLWAHIRMQYAVAAARERFKIISLLNIVLRSVIVAASLALLYLGYGAFALVVVLIPISAAQVLVAYVSLGAAGGVYRFRPNLPDARYLLRQGVPIALGGIAATAYYSLDIPLLTSLGAPDAPGYYANGMRFFLLCLTLADLLANVTYPIFSRKANGPEEDQRFALMRCMKASALAALPLAVGGSVLCQAIVITLCGERYLPSAPAVAVLMWVLAGEMLSNTLVLYLRAKMRQRVPAIIYSAALAAKVLLAFWVIPRYGMNGFLAMNLALSAAMTASLLLAARRVLPSLCLRATARTVYFRPFIASLIMGAALWPIRHAFIGLTVPAGVAVYAMALWALGGLDEFDRRMLKGTLGG